MSGSASGHDNGQPGGMSGVVVGSLLLGFAAIFTKFAEHGGTGPLAIGFYRMLFALPLIVLMAWMSKERWGEARHRWWAFAAGWCFLGDLWLWHESLRFTTAANATLLACLAPLWVALISVAFFHARLRKRGWTGLALALSGAAVLGLAKGARWGSGLGEALAIGASLAYGVFTVALTEARRGLGAKNALLVVTSICVFGFGLFGVGTGAAFHGYTPKAWAALIGLGLVCQVAAWAFITWGLGHVQAHVGAVVLLLQPVATVGLAWWLLHEPMKPLQGLGVLFILLGVGLAASAPPLPKRSVTEP
ncbi:MAG: DMT family transporter [Acidobacteria bacterium]|nr:DMT family transporter [Acidobacteriota bacterium]